MPFSRQDFANSDHDADSRDNQTRDQIVSLLKQRLSDEVVEMWFESGRSIRCENLSIKVVADSEFKLSRISTKFGTEVRQVVRTILGVESEIGFELDKESTNSDAKNSDGAGESNSVLFNGTVNVDDSVRSTDLNENTNESRRNQESQVVIPAGNHPRNPNRKPGTESFWFGESNRIVEAGVQQMFRHPGMMTPFVVYGPPGSGKTHLLESIVVDARRKYNLNRCIYLSAEQFTSNFVQSLRGTGLPVFRRKYRDLDLLAIDDVQFFAGKNATLGEFQHTVDSLIRNGKQVVLASDRPPIDLGRLGEEITARMMSGLVCPLQYPDAEGRKKILREICRKRGIAIGDDVVSLIGENLSRDVRRISGAINRIHALSVAMESEITVEIARESLTDLFSISAATTSLGSIEKCVCNLCGVKPADLKSSSRQKKISAARMLAMYLSRRHTQSACSEIGDYYGGRSHSTVIAAQKKVDHWLQVNQSIDLPHAKYPAKDVIGRIENALRLG